MATSLPTTRLGRTGMPAATLELKEDDLSDIAAAIRATGAGSGPSSPVR
jgi:mono/diheme cytochrome c family protein